MGSKTTRSARLVRAFTPVLLLHVLGLGTFFVFVEPQHLRDVLTLMFTCGMYDSSGSWAYTVGLPAKSGVSGGILAVVPGKMGLAVYSPRLDDHGHSVRGVEVFKEWSAAWGLSIFHVGAQERTRTSTMLLAST